MCGTTYAADLIDARSHDYDPREEHEVWHEFHGIQFDDFAYSLAELEKEYQAELDYDYGDDEF